MIQLAKEGVDLALWRQGRVRPGRTSGDLVCTELLMVP